MIKQIIAFTLIAASLISCIPDGSSYTAKNLIEYGIPFTIKVPNPDSLIVNKDDLGPIEDITIDGGDGYFLQIYASIAESSDIAKLKAEQLNLVKEQPYFSKIEEENEAGFIFENSIDSISNYGFRYIQIKGDREFIFQNHLSRLFSLEEVEKMYNSIQPEE